MLKKIRQKRLQKYVKKYFSKYPDIKLVAVSGSVGKTQAKTAIATVLSEKFRVRMFHGNRISGNMAPLAILGIDYPGEVKGFFAWHRVFKAARSRIKQPQDTDIIVHELNASGEGDIVSYGEYIAPDITVITAVTESNLRSFKSVDAMAAEYLSAGSFSRSLLINRDDVDGKFAGFLTNSNMNTYGLDGSAEFRFEEGDYSREDGFTGSVIVPGLEAAPNFTVNIHDDFSLRQLVAACAIGVKLGMTAQEVSSGAAKFRSLPGHNNILRGLGGSLIIDDTVNNSPLGVKTALQSLYKMPAPQKIAVIGSMCRLSAASQLAHQESGGLCDPAQLAWVVTVGDEANRFLAPAARGRGCQVKECANALEAGAFVHSVMERDAIILFNGHEEDFIEEGVKIILKSTDQERSLVRQDSYSLARKVEAFSRFS